MYFNNFSHKQEQALCWWIPESPYRNYDAIICDGAVRSGKTLCMSMSFVLWAMTNFTGVNLAICGKTITSCERNVLTPLRRIITDVLGMQCHYSRSLGYMEVAGTKAVNRFYLFGGKDEGSAALIQGVTLAGILLDEVTLMPRSFVEQAVARCSVEGSKFWFNCNPDGPLHWFNVEWVSKAERRKALHLHFTMLDNPSLSPRMIARYESLYTGVFYDRFIRGLWVVASGVIYDSFSRDKNVVKDFNADSSGVSRYITVDYGTTNPTVFLAVSDNDPWIDIEKEYYYDSRDPKNQGRQKTDSEYGDDFDRFVKEWGFRPRRVIIDPSAASFRTELRRRGYLVKEADNDVLDGIRLVSGYVHQGYLRVHESCVNTIAEFLSYVWDSTAAENGKEQPVKIMDHAMDAIRYFVKTIRKKGRRNIGQ